MQLKERLKGSESTVTNAEYIWMSLFCGNTKFIDPEISLQMLMSKSICYSLCAVSAYANKT